MTSDDLRQSLAVLACDLEERPRGAPSILDVAKAIQQVTRDEGGALVVSFAATVTRELEAFVAAEQQCCADISWNLEQAGAQTRLKVVATAEQLDLLEKLFTQEVAGFVDVTTQLKEEPRERGYASANIIARRPAPFPGAELPKQDCC